ncbi:hypothetical protein F5D26_06130 [Burkholderia pseudomallei]|nr:hypothetical protein F5D26_06130 [Burkholderia pseudomallei]
MRARRSGEVKRVRRRACRVPGTVGRWGDRGRSARCSDQARRMTRELRCRTPWCAWLHRHARGGCATCGSLSDDQADGARVSRRPPS